MTEFLGMNGHTTSGLGTSGDSTLEMSGTHSFYSSETDKYSDERSPLMYSPEARNHDKNSSVLHYLGKSASPKAMQNPKGSRYVRIAIINGQFIPIRIYS